MPEVKLKMTLFHFRRGLVLGTLETYYVLGRKPAGGMVARVMVPEDLELKKDDTLVFDFTTDPFEMASCV